MTWSITASRLIFLGLLSFTTGGETDFKDEPDPSIALSPIGFVNHSFMGEFIVAKGLILWHSDSFWKGLVRNICTCRVLCRSHSSCVAFSTEPQSSNVLCRLSSKGPFSSTLKVNESGLYTFWLKSIQTKRYRMGTDGLLYIIPGMRLSWNKAKIACQMIPGHRLGMYHTIANYNALKQLQTDIGRFLWVDLSKLDGNPVWGDGVKFANSEVSQVVVPLVNGGVNETFLANDLTFNDIPPNNFKLFACQSKPWG